MISTQKLRDMNLNSAADELDQLRSFKAKLESQKPVGKVSGTFVGAYSIGNVFFPDDVPLPYGTELYTMPVPAGKPERITEQNARVICTEYNNFRMDGHGMTPSEIINKWLRSEGRELLSKLNADRQVLDDGSAQKLWDYYQTLLKHYGFEGITDLLSKYRKLAEQVSVVTMPDVATPEMEAAAEKYWNERRLKGLSDDPRTWAGVYATMRAAAPSQNQHNSNDEGFKLIPNPPCGFNLIAYNRHTEEWLYINHANTWQPFQGPIKQPHGQQSADLLDEFATQLAEKFPCGMSAGDVFAEAKSFKLDRCPSHESEQGE